MLFFENIFIPYLLTNKIDTVIHLGDLVDRRKYINYQVLHVIRQKILRLFEKHKITIHLIIGNHDTYYKNSKKINAPESLFPDLKFLKIYTEPQKILFDVPVLFIPWITEETSELSMQLLDDHSVKTVFGHFQITGYEMYKGIISTEGMNSSTFSHFDNVFSGHFHHKSHVGNIHYLGSPYELTFNELESIKGFHVFDTITNELEFIPNENRMFYKHVYNDLKKELNELLQFDFSVYNEKFVKIVVEHKENVFFFDTVLEEIRKQNPHEISIIDFTEIEFNENPVEYGDELHDTMHILFKCIDNIQSSYIKSDHERNVLKELMQKLYLKAHEMES